VVSLWFFGGGGSVASTISVGTERQTGRQIGRSTPGMGLVLSPRWRPCSSLLFFAHHMYIDESTGELLLCFPFVCVFCMARESDVGWERSMCLGGRAKGHLEGTLDGFDDLATKDTSKRVYFSHP
jgi:hypothetical protein